MENGQHNVLQPISDDFNAENWQKSLDISAPLDMPSPETFLTPEATDEIPEASRPSEPAKLSEAPEDPNKLGQITTVEKPVSLNVSRVNYNPANIKTTGDRLDKATMTEIANVENRLAETHDLNNFYEEIRGEGGMMEINLNNLKGESQ